ncbi:ATP-binding protein [Paenibacillus sp. GCM10028914]|uniref:ATP-binding protein n=1 Tax=Paenibacillus sp. GCM10028914 TaxID=3273416 RepID=UPI00361CFA50
MDRPFEVITYPFENTYSHQSESRIPSEWETFFKRYPDPAVILDKDDLLMKTNTAFDRVFGWSEDELVGLHAYDLPNIPEDKKFEVSRNKEIIDFGEAIKEYETIRLTSNGTLLQVRISCFPLQDRDNRFYGRAVILKVIREHREESNTTLLDHIFFNADLAAGIAHEIRNPLTTLKGFLQLMQSNHISVHRAPYYYEIMESEIEQIEYVLSKLLLLAKPKENLLKLIDVSTLIKDAVASSEEAAGQQVKITTDLDCSLSLIECDVTQIRQVFSSIIENGIESMPDGGALTIQLRSNQQEVIICFRDEGLGIPAHILCKLGQPFYTTQTKGIGLGFMISKKIIEAHRGSIKVSSEEKKGTLIEIRLPLYQN